MTQCVNVERIQYGVGQGCFHGQELIYGTEDQNATLFFRLVYDCGSSGRDNPLKWPINHFTEAQYGFDIDVAYLSHFEIDHVNGLRLLSETAFVQRIFAPFIDWKKGFHIIVEQLSSGAEIAKVMELMDVIAEVITQGTIGGTPVTMVRDGDGPPGLPGGGDNPRGELPDGPGVVEIAGSTSGARVVSHDETTTISAGSLGGAKTSIWEVVHWYYAAEDSLTKLVWSEVNAIDGAKTKGFTEGCTSKDRSATLDWISKNSAAIKAAYNSALKIHNNDRENRGLRRIRENHNVVSLAVYSGPTRFGSAALRTCSEGHRKAYYFDNEDGYIWFHSYDKYWDIVPKSWEACPLGWIATGDAMLEIQDVWESFERHFNATRLKGCSTVLIPHHGSSKGENFRSDLALPGRNCVISAGANWPYYHPGRETMRKILARNATAVVVTEATPLGYTEFVGLAL